MSQITQNQSSQYPSDLPFDLTPEEVRIYNKCRTEGIYQKAIPFGILCGIGGFLGATAGPLRSSKFGAKPAVIGCGLIGYSIARLAHIKVCIQRVLEEVPDGNLQKAIRQTYNEKYPRVFVEPEADNYYVPIEVPKQSTTSDIDLPPMSNFDTVPSEYYNTNVENSENPTSVKNYISYDDLRAQNRMEHSKKYPSLPQDRPMVRRPNPPVSPQPSAPVAGQQTKYGDTWDA